MSMREKISCLFCGASHDSTVKEGQFFSFVCDMYGGIYISRRAIVEFQCHPNRLEVAKDFASQCKKDSKVFSATFHASEEGLRVVAI